MEGTTMNTETFTRTHKNRVTSWQTKVTVEYSPAVIGDLRKESRWFKELGQFVLSVKRVKVSHHSVSVPSSQPYSEEGFEVIFECGARGWVPDRREGQELDALVMGTAGFLHGLAVWRKRGHIVGSPVPWLMAQKGPRARLNADRVPRCCALELYYRAAGKAWPPVQSA